MSEKKNVIQMEKKPEVPQRGQVDIASLSSETILTSLAKVYMERDDCARRLQILDQQIAAHRSLLEQKEREANDAGEG